MAMIITKPDRHAKCACCQTDKRKLHEFQFFSDVSFKQCIVLCDMCVHTMDNSVTEEVIDEYAARKNKVRNKTGM